MTKDSNLDVLNLPRFPFKIKKENDKLNIFDALRKRFVRLTPEEWVRQHFVQFLIEELNYPAGKIGNEIAVKINGLTKRCDSVIYNNYGKPEIIVEYKAPKIQINQSVFDQIFVYNTKLNVPFLFITNGISHYACVMKKGKPVFLKSIPAFAELYKYLE